MNNEIFTRVQLTALMGYCIQKFGTIDVPLYDIVRTATADAVNGDTTLAKYFALAVDINASDSEID